MVTVLRVPVLPRLGIDCKGGSQNQNRSCSCGNSCKGISYVWYKSCTCNDGVNMVARPGIKVIVAVTVCVIMVVGKETSRQW